jgi:hypothetical protein
MQSFSFHEKSSRKAKKTGKSHSKMQEWSCSQGKSDRKKFAINSKIISHPDSRSFLGKASGRDGTATLRREGSRVSSDTLRQGESTPLSFLWGLTNEG